MPHIQLGIIGNMGPEADEVFQAQVRKASIEQGATKDQDHLPIVVVKNPNIPDRTEAILSNGEDPVPEMINSVRKLEACGVQFAVMPCNTAHFFRDRIQKQTDIYVFDMIASTVDYINNMSSKAIVGLLATNGTCQSEIYDRHLKEASIEFYKPERSDQEEFVHSAIYGPLGKNGGGKSKRIPKGIKAGVYDENACLLSQIIQKLQNQKGINTIILGCTELSLISRKLEADFPGIIFVDPMRVVAKRAVDVHIRAKEWLEQFPKNLSFLCRKPKIENIRSNEDIANYVVAKLLTRNITQTKPIYQSSVHPLRP